MPPKKRHNIDNLKRKDTPRSDIDSFDLITEVGNYIEENRQDLKAAAHNATARATLEDLVDDSQESHESWIKRQHPFLVAVARALASLSEKEEQDLRVSNFIKAGYKLINTRYVDSYQLSGQLLIHNTTHSEISQHVYSKGSSAGSQSKCRTIRKAGGPPPEPSKNDVILAFDNNEKGQGTYSAALSSKKEYSVVTAIGELSFAGDLQQNPVTSLPSPTLETVHKKSTLEEEADGAVLWLRNRELSKHFDSVHSRLAKSHEGPSEGDRDLENVTEEPMEVSTTSDDQSQKPETSSRSNCEGVPTYHNDPSRMRLLDPVLVNPNSFENLAKVFREILARYPDREWIPVVSDGVPHVLGLKLIAESFICLKCEERVFRDFDKHRKSRAPCTYAEKRREFERLILIPGHGHIVMNERKSLREVTFPLFGSVLAKLLGCQTPKSVLWFKNCTDNHQARQHDQIEGAAIIETLLQLYIEDRVKEGCSFEDVDLSGFEEWVSAATPNIRLCFDLWFYYYIGLEAHEIGTRTNNRFMIIGGMMSLVTIFHSRHHPIYRQLVESYLFFLKNGDEQLVEFVLKTQTNLKKADPTSGQAIDFRLEELNKSIQLLLPPGMPTPSDWLEVYRNHDLYIKNREFWYKNSDITDPKLVKSVSYRSEEKIEKEKVALINTFLDRNYFRQTTLSSLDEKVEVAPELLDIVKKGNIIRRANLEEVIRCDTFHVLSTSTDRVMVNKTEEARTKKSLKDLKIEIGNILSSIPEPDLREKWSSEWQKWSLINTIESAECFLEKLKNCDDA